jgi:hypothetical protein
MQKVDRCMVAVLALKIPRVLVVDLAAAMVAENYEIRAKSQVASHISVVSNG